MTNEEQQQQYSAYATHLRDEHRQLRAGLQRADQQWQEVPARGGPKGKAREGLLASLTDLRAVLARHLAEEEAGGCLEEAIIHLPALGRMADDLEREDPQLLARLDELIGRLRKAPRSLRKIEDDYRRLAGQIREHVAAESKIVEQSFGMEVD